MSFYALTLVIIAALMHASWNFLAKRNNHGVVFAFSTSLFSSIIWFPIVLTVSIQRPEESILTWELNGWLIALASAVLHSFYYVILLRGYAFSPLSVVYPVARGTGPLLSAFAAIIIFSEAATFNTVLGIIFIASGVMVLSWAKNAVSIDRAAIKRGVIWGMLTGFFISLYTVTDAVAVKTMQMNPLLYDYSVQVMRMFLLLPFAIKSSISVRNSIKENYVIFLSVAILSPLAYILVLYAMTMAPVSHVAPAREMSMLIAAFLGGKFLKEGQVVMRIIGAAMIGLGVVVLMLD